MIQKIKNTLLILVSGVDLTTVTDIEFYILYGELFFKYVPVVTNQSEMVVTMPKEDADLLEANTEVSLQFAYTDEDGNHIPSEIETHLVGKLLNPEGYPSD